jgi:serine protease inhibitor
LQLGVEKAFDIFQADFSGIAGEKGELAIAKVSQKTYIDVNEIGVEAAAATDISEYLVIFGVCFLLKKI